MAYSFFNKIFDIFYLVSFFIILYSIMKKTIQGNAFAIVRSLRDAGYMAYIVGGAVRDMVMGAEPKDYDVVTDASVDDVSELFERTYPVGARFGVSIVVADNHAFEVAQFRSDGVYKDGRRPSEVKPAGEMEDILRRDFTINALLYDPDEDKIIDHISGIDDINRKLIRTIGNPESGG